MKISQFQLTGQTVIHTCGGAFTGSSHSLMELIRAFPTQSVSPHVITQK